MLTRESAIEKANSFVNELVNSGVNINKAILFGSYLTNSQHEYSDIDLALVADNFCGFRTIDKEQFINICIKKEFVSLELQTYSTDYYNNMNDGFVEEVVKKGIIIYQSVA